VVTIRSVTLYKFLMIIFSECNRVPSEPNLDINGRVMKTFFYIDISSVKVKFLVSEQIENHDINYFFNAATKLVISRSRDLRSRHRACPIKFYTSVIHF
jgi:hypothetical protein